MPHVRFGSSFPVSRETSAFSGCLSPRCIGHSSTFRLSFSLHSAALDFWHDNKLLPTTWSVPQRMQACLSDPMGYESPPFFSHVFFCLWKSREMPGFCGNQTAWAMGGGLQGLSRRGRHSYRGSPAFCGSPTHGVIGGGVRGCFTTRASLLQGKPCILWEPRPLGDGWWSARLHRDEGVAPTEDALHFVGAPPSG